MGVNFGNDNELKALADAVGAVKADWTATPLVPGAKSSEPMQDVTNPADRRMKVGTKQQADAATIAPADIACAVNDLMAEHGKLPIASDMGDCLFTAMDIEHTALVAPGYYATMGYGVPAGLGLQAATGQREPGRRAAPPHCLARRKSPRWRPRAAPFHRRAWRTSCPR